MKNHFSMKRILAFLLALTCSFSLLASAGSNIVNTDIAVADSAEMKQNKNNISNAQSKLAELEKKQKELDKKISSTSNNIKTEQENQKAIEEQIDTVQETILTLTNSINALNTKIQSLEKSIQKKEKQVETKKNEIDNGIVDFKQRIRAMYINGNDTYSDILIGATDFYDMLMKIELVKKVAEHDDKMIDNLIALKGQYETEKKELEKDKSELETNKKDLESQKKTQQSQKDKLEKLFAKSKAAMEKLKKDKAAFEKNKATVNKESDAAEAQIQKLYKQQEKIKAKEKAEAERRRKEAEEAARRAQEAAQNNNNNSSPSDASGNTTGQTSTDNSDYNYTDKSQFTWPVPGFYHISYGVGWRWGAYHKGIDIWSQGIRGANICAADSGTVILVSNTCTHDYGKTNSCGCGGGYGNYCIIDHGNGYWTLYGHSHHISVTQGQHVEKGDVLGIVGSTGHSTGDHLHFEVRINGEAVDPTLYV